MGFGPAGTPTTTVASGGTISVISGGWTPGATVTAVLHSDPVVLGTAIASSAGTIDASFVLPSSVPAGSHSLSLTGTAADGSVDTVSLPVTVTSLAGASEQAAAGNRSAALSFTG